MSPVGFRGTTSPPVVSRGFSWSPGGPRWPPWSPLRSVWPPWPPVVSCACSCSCSHGLTKSLVLKVLRHQGVMILLSKTLIILIIPSTTLVVEGSSIFLPSRIINSQAPELVVPPPVASRGLPWSPVLFWLFFQLFAPNLPGLPSPPVVSRAVLAVSLLSPWSPVASRGLPWSPASPPVVSRFAPRCASRGLLLRLPGSAAVSRFASSCLPWSPVVSRGLPFRAPLRFPWSPHSPPVVCRGLPLRLPWPPVVTWCLPWCPASPPVASRGLLLLLLLLLSLSWSPEI